MILSVLLPDGLTASAFATKDSSFVFTSLASAYAFTVDGEGNISAEKSLARPYNAIHNGAANYYTAVPMHGERRIYLLDSVLNEIRYINVNGTDSVNDAQMFVAGGENMIAVTRGHSVEALHSDGSFSHFISGRNECIEYLSYVRSESVSACAYVRGGVTMLEVYTENEFYSHAFSPGFTFRSLAVTAENEIHALLGYKYVYGIVYPVYERGSFLLPDSENLILEKLLS